jgi:TPP-dependent 2-oxoacid decarboxylase
MMTDFNSGAFTARLDPEKTIDIGHHRTRIGSNVYPNVEMSDLVAALTPRAAKRSGKSLIEPVSLRERWEVAVTRLRLRRFIPAERTF